jgi:hypothetical protein
MGRVDHPGTRSQDSEADRLDPEEFDGNGAADDVDDGIDRSHLVEVDRLDGDRVHPGLGRRQTAEHPLGAVADRRREPGSGEDAEEILERTVRVVAAHRDLDPGGIEAPDLDRVGTQPMAVTRQGKGVERRADCLDRCAEV